MAVDSWLFNQVDRGLHAPTLRFYAWEPVTVSLGYFQQRWPERWSTLTWEGHPLKLVRRPSGGRAVLHHGDLTYCVVTKMEGHSRHETYQNLCQFLVDGWENLGKTLRFGPAGRGYHQETSCFRVSTGADLVDEAGQKFIGSAQLWRASTVLQHGSMALSPKAELERLLFGCNRRPVDQICPPSLHLDSIITQLKQAAGETLNMRLHQAPITPQEWEEIEPYFDRTKV